MKMAKASKADLEMAIDLCRALDTLTQRWCPAVPEECEKGVDEDAIESFDRDDAEQCQRVLGYLLDVAGRASLFRVVWNCVVMLDPTNRFVDPDADTIEHHPDVQALESAKTARPGEYAPAAVAGPSDWRELAAKVMDALADAQEQTNAAYPDHVSCYPEWEMRARWLRWLADMFRTGKPAGNGAGQPAVLAALAAAPTTQPESAALADAHSRQLLLRCLQALSTLEGEDTTEQEMLDALTGDIKEAVGLEPLVPGSLI